MKSAYPIPQTSLATDNSSGVLHNVPALIDSRLHTVMTPWTLMCQARPIHALARQRFRRPPGHDLLSILLGERGCFCSVISPPNRVW